MPGITELNLGFNDLSVIDARAFQGLGNLTLLYLYFNPRLRWIDPLAFVDLPALQYLHLAGCQLSGLTHHHFAAQAHLTMLMLRCVSAWKTQPICTWRTCRRPAPTGILAPLIRTATMTVWK